MDEEKLKKLLEAVELVENFCYEQEKCSECCIGDDCPFRDAKEFSDNYK